MRKFRIDNHAGARDNAGVMKHLFLSLSLAAALSAGMVTPAAADDDNGGQKTSTSEKRTAKKGADTDSSADTKTDKKGAKKDIKGSGDKKAMSRAVKELKPFNGKISATAKYVLMFHFSSVEAICEEPLEKLVEAQKDMKKAKMEVLLISHDKDAALSQKFVKEKKANKFAMVMANNPLLQPDDEKKAATNTKPKKKKKGEEKEEALPGFNAKAGSGTVVILDSAGGELASGKADLVDKWQDYVEEPTTKKSDSDDSAE